MYIIIAGYMLSIELQSVYVQLARHSRCVQTCSISPRHSLCFQLWLLQAMEYMVNCKYHEATEHAGHPVDNHCVILVGIMLWLWPLQKNGSDLR